MKICEWVLRIEIMTHPHNVPVPKNITISFGHFINKKIKIISLKQIKDSNYPYSCYSHIIPSILSSSFIIKVRLDQLACFP